MITENLSTLKIHKLTQAQYDRELAAGRIDESALYLTPNEEVDFSQFASASDVEELKTKVGDTSISEQISAVIPTVTASDNGKFLRVIDGVWAAATIPNAEEATFGV